MVKTIVVLGGGGFIAGHLAKKLYSEGNNVIVADIKSHEYFTHSDISSTFLIGDLRNKEFVETVITKGVDEVYQLAADMGGAGYLFTGENDAQVMYNSTMINLNVIKRCVEVGVKKVLFTSSACVYPEYNQMDPLNPKCTESTVYPAEPDSEYGWEKLYGERLYLAFHKNHNIDSKIVRLHNVFGPMGTYDGGKEKAPAAICRKVAKAKEGDFIEIWGDGLQTRSFLYIDECIEGLTRIMNSTTHTPLNLGSEELISMNDFAQLVIKISGKNLKIKNIDGPLGVRGRTSDNKLIHETIGWKPTQQLQVGLEKTYNWINTKVND
jgi:nucleoside-diphosphate-sugar epimerase